MINCSLTDNLLLMNLWLNLGLSFTFSSINIFNLYFPSLFYSTVLISCCHKHLCCLYLPTVHSHFHFFSFSTSIHPFLCLVTPLSLFLAIGTNLLIPLFSQNSYTSILYTDWNSISQYYSPNLGVLKWCLETCNTHHVRTAGLILCHIKTRY